MGKPLIGVTPPLTGTSLSLIESMFAKKAVKKTPSHSVIYLYGANMRTGGITNDSAVIGKVKSSIENTKVVAGSILPDVPLPQARDQLSTNKGPQRLL